MPESPTELLRDLREEFALLPGRLRQLMAERPPLNVRGGDRPPTDDGVAPALSQGAGVTSGVQQIASEFGRLRESLLSLAPGEDRSAPTAGRASAGASFDAASPPPSIRPLDLGANLPTLSPRTDATPPVPTTMNAPQLSPVAVGPLAPFAPTVQPLDFDASRRDPQRTAEAFDPTTLAGGAGLASSALGDGGAGLAGMLGALGDLLQEVRGLRQDSSGGQRRREPLPPVGPPLSYGPMPGARPLEESEGYPQASPSVNASTLSGLRGAGGPAGGSRAFAPRADFFEPGRRSP